MKGQANLPALAIALLVVTAVASLSVALADGAFSTAERDAPDRAIANGVTERVVAGDAAHTDRRNVLNESRMTAASLSGLVPPNVDASVRIDGEPVYERGNPDGGATARRIVLVADRQVVEIEPPLRFGEVTLPRRTPSATISIDAGSNVETVSANGRVVLYDPDGLEGDHRVDLSHYETTTLRFDGSPSPGDVTVTTYPRQTRKAHLEVIVDG